MSIRATIRTRFPALWRRLRAGKALLAKVIHALYRRSWAKAEESYDTFVDGYAQRTDDFFFIQVGANDGIKSDPINALIKKFAWNGVLIEPQPEIFVKLLENYKDSRGLHFENVAVSADSNRVRLHRVRATHVKQPFHERIATLRPGKGPIIGFDVDAVEEIEVDAMTIQGLLDKYAPTRWDLLQIDTEGYDFEVIKMINFKTQYPLLCCYEHKHLSLRERRLCRSLLRRNGYKILTMKYDTAAIHTSIIT